MVLFIFYLVNIINLNQKRIKNKILQRYNKKYRYSKIKHNLFLNPHCYFTETTNMIILKNTVNHLILHQHQNRMISFDDKVQDMYVELNVKV